jgi:Kdo2-lipid IVA lauroyltransferase/acyltransferase
VVLYRPARKAWLNVLLEKARQRPGFLGVPINMSGIRTMVRTLRKGGFVGLLPDQVPPLGQGVWAPFFNRPAYTMTLLGKLAQQTGAPVLLSWCERLAPGQGFKVVITQLNAPEFSLDSQANSEQTARALNQALEQLIRRVPYQYLWGYARHKQPRHLE